MGIRKKIFLISAAVMLLVLLLSYGIMYFFYMKALQDQWGLQ